MSFGFSDDIYKTKKQYLRKLEEIKNWNTSENNKKHILEFLTKTEIEGISVVQRMKYFYSFKTLLKVVNKDFECITKEDLEKFLLSMENYKPKTKNTRWYCIKKFFQFIGKDELFKDFKVNFNSLNRKLPEELLTEEEIKLMIENATNLRDKVFISTLYESGCRIGELLTRKLRNVIFDEYGAVLIVDGKTGMRRIRLINSVPLLANWISNHPFKNNPDAFLWINLNTFKTQNRFVEYRTISKMLEEVAKKSGIKKKIHPHLFRHSRATHLAKYLTEQELKVFFGWSNSSKMASIYVHLSGKDIDNKILEIHGIKPKEPKTQHLKPIVCIRCNTQNDSTAKYCKNCGMVLDIREAVNLEESKDDFQEFLIEAFKEWKKKKVEIAKERKSIIFTVEK
jgi:integrase/recombinase XerD